MDVFAASCEKFGVTILESAWLCILINIDKAGVLPHATCLMLSYWITRVHFYTLNRVILVE